MEIAARGREVSVNGEESGVALAARLLSEFSKLIERGFSPKKPELLSAIRILKEEPETSLIDFFENRSLGPAIRQVVAPRNVRQQEYLQAILEQRHRLRDRPGRARARPTWRWPWPSRPSWRSGCKRIVLTRPAVEAGEKLGFLPGDLEEKVNPYLRPLYDALYDMLGYEKVGRLLERSIIEVAPLAFMRGRTLNDAFIILDEAQNTTSEQMKMFLTRIGFGSKAVITGDVTQVDLPQGKVSGLKEADADPLRGRGDPLRLVRPARRRPPPAGAGDRQRLRDVRARPPAAGRLRAARAPPRKRPEGRGTPAAKARASTRRRRHDRRARVRSGVRPR